MDTHLFEFGDDSLTRNGIGIEFGGLFKYLFFLFIVYYIFYMYACMLQSATMINCLLIVTGYIFILMEKCDILSKYMFIYSNLHPMALKK